MMQSAQSSRTVRAERVRHSSVKSCSSSCDISAPSSGALISEMLSRTSSENWPFCRSPEPSQGILTDDTGLMRVADDFSDSADIQLLFDMSDVGTDRARGQVELRRDLGHGAALRQQIEHLVLARREALMRGPLRVGLSALYPG